jgi:hypothetical protein
MAAYSDADFKHIHVGLNVLWTLALIVFVLKLGAAIPARVKPWWDELSNVMALV